MPTTYTIVELPLYAKSPHRPNRWLIVSEHTGEAMASTKRFDTAIALITFWHNAWNELQI